MYIRGIRSTNFLRIATIILLLAFPSDVNVIWQAICIPKSTEDNVVKSLDGKAVDRIWRMKRGLVGTSLLWNQVFFHVLSRDNTSPISSPMIIERPAISLGA